MNIEKKEHYKTTKPVLQRQYSNINLIDSMYDNYITNDSNKYIPIDTTLTKNNIKILINELITKNYISNREIKSDSSDEYSFIINITEREKEYFKKLNNKLIDFYKICFLFNASDICIGIYSKYFDDSIPNINILTTYIVNEILYYIHIMQYEYYPEYLIKISDDIKMLNYYYNINITNKELNDEQKYDHYLYIFTNIIYKYAYPYCTRITNILSEEEKQLVLNDEFNLIKIKIEEYKLKYNLNLNIYQIPRILYDLFNICLQFEFKNIKRITLEYNDDFKNYEEYCNVIDRLSSNTLSFNKLNFMDCIIKLNNLINKTFNHINTFNNYYLLLKYLVNYIQIKSYELNIYQKIAMIITDINCYKIIYNILLLELGIFPNGKYNTSTNNLILYRGTHDGDKNFFIIENNKMILRSLSFNTSILNGIFFDESASTLTYFQNFMDKYNYKNFFIIKKFFYNDNSDENKLFFIPPISPYLLLYMRGEYWHVRTKISTKNSDKYEISNSIYGIAYEIFDPITNIVDFLNINLQYPDITINDLEILFNNVNRYQIFEKYYYKYLKYKMKYLNKLFF
jgi:hypothetical protein